MTHTPADDSLPPLPNPLKNVRVYADHGPTMREPEDEVFDADQMRQYARDAIALTRPPGGSERLREALIARRSMFCGAMPLATVVDDAKLNSAVEEIDWMLGLLADQRHEPQGDVPFATVREVVRALTRLGRTTPCSQEEQAARAVELIGDLCREVQRHFDSLASPQGAEQRQEGVSKWAPPYPDAAKDPFNALLTPHPEQRQEDDDLDDLLSAMDGWGLILGERAVKREGRDWGWSIADAAAAIRSLRSPHPAPAATQGDAVAGWGHYHAATGRWGSWLFPTKEMAEQHGHHGYAVRALAALSSPTGVQAAQVSDGVTSRMAERFLLSAPLRQVLEEASEQGEYGNATALGCLRRLDKIRSRLAQPSSAAHDGEVSGG